MFPELLAANDSVIRSSCKERIESLEHWIRRLIDDLLTSTYGDYFNHIDEHGNRLIKKSLSDQVEERRVREPFRYPRKIDAVLLEDAISIVCNPHLYDAHFKVALRDAYPDGLAEARTFLSRVAAPRNNLAHANSISLRQAEQVICYSNDVIDSLKTYYIERGMQNVYNVPSILKFVDSFGTSLTRSQFGESPFGGILKSLANDSRFNLRPGDILTLEIEIDPAFSPDTYTLRWDVPYQQSALQHDKTRLVIPITVAHVNELMWVCCTLVTNLQWHRHGRHDDQMQIGYRVLPPL